MPTKRALDFGQTPRKKARSSGPVPVYRMTKPEMKAADTTISFTAATSANSDLTGSIVAGTAHFERVGSKIKAWRIEGILNCSVPVRVQVLAPNDVSVAPSNTVAQLYNYRTDRLLAEYNFDPNTYGSTSTFHWSHKLPFGQNVIYDGTAGTDCVKGKIIVRFTTSASTTLTGETRLYFTDY